MGCEGERIGRIEACLAAERLRHGVPGVLVGMMSNTRESVLADGVLNVATGEPVNADSLFQIGSITKAYTATMIFRLIAQGRLSLETPVRTLGPDLAAVFDGPRAPVTVSQLLAHTSGIDGDCFLDSGDDDDCVARLMPSLAALPQLHAPGERFSYCNSGYICLGRAIEHLCGQPWRRALNELLLAPLGMSETAVLPEETMRFATAVGHVADHATGRLSIASPLLLPRSNEPAGSTPWSSMRDLLKFTRFHLEAGVAPDPTTLLPGALLQEMRRRRVLCPPYAPFTAWAAGWALFDWGERRLFGHDGQTRGQAAFLRVDPATGLVLAMFANGGDARGLFEALAASSLGDLPGFRLPAPPQPAAEPVELDARYDGTYAKFSNALCIVSRDGRLYVSVEPRNDPVGITGQPEGCFEPVSETVFVARSGTSRLPTVLHFGDFDPQGRPMTVSLNLRMYRREENEGELS